MRFELMVRRGGTKVPEVIWEHKIVGCTWAMIRGTLSDDCLSFLLARESVEGEGRYAWKGMDMCRG